VRVNVKKRGKGQPYRQTCQGERKTPFCVPAKGKDVSSVRRRLLWRRQAAKEGEGKGRSLREEAKGKELRGERVLSGKKDDGRGTLEGIKPNEEGRDAN